MWVAVTLEEHMELQIGTVTRGAQVEYNVGQLVVSLELLQPVGAVLEVVTCWSQSVWGLRVECPV